VRTVQEICEEASSGLARESGTAAKLSEHEESK
jgi:hypothetical protein